MAADDSLLPFMLIFIDLILVAKFIHDVRSRRIGFKAKVIYGISIGIISILALFHSLLYYLPEI